MSNPAAVSAITAAALAFESTLAKLTSACPNPGAGPSPSEEEWKEITKIVARLHRQCTGALVDAGLADDEDFERSTEINTQTEAAWRFAEDTARATT